MSKRHLTRGTLMVIGCVAVSGIMLDFSPKMLTGVHLFTGLGSMVPVAFFLIRHWWQRRKSLKHHPNARLGFLVAACLVILSLSGLALLKWTNVPLLRGLHSGGTIALLLALTGHATWQMRIWWMRVRPRSQRPFHFPSRFYKRSNGYVVGLLTVATLAAFIRPTGQPQEIEPQHTSDLPIAHSSLGDNILLTADTCAGCHTDLTTQWQTSAHAHAASNPYYLALTGLFIQEKGVEAVRYCATCHNPIGLMGGEVALEMVGTAHDTLSDDSAPAYEVRSLDISLPISVRANEGVTCAMCHQAVTAAEEPQNGTLTLAADADPLPDSILDRLALRINPAEHESKMQPDVIAQAQLCGACHNLHLPNGMPLENTYDEWLASPYPAQGVTCQQCHMPPVPARRADSNLPAAVASHGGLPGRPSSLPDVAANPELLQQAATLDLTWQITAGVIQAAVVLTNTGAGHQLPTGASDLRQMWLEVTLEDSADRIFWQSGGLDEYGALDPAAVQFRKVLGDADGRPIELHRIWVATSVLSDTTLAPLEVRHVPYTLPLPETATYPMTLTVRLLYRDVSPQFAEFALQRPVRDLPVWQMTAVSVQIPEP
jgi:hypothetical protein